jgi:hypothetical protein
MRSGSKNGNLWVWDDNDDPGAGSKSTSKTEGNTGLNANWNELDVAVFTQHLANGSHKNDVIHGASLHTDCLDGSTLEFSAGSGTKVARIKDAGVTLPKISASGASSGQAIMYNGSAVAWGTPTPALADASVTRAKLESYLGSMHILGDPRLAGGSAGNTPAAELEWTETSTTYVKKASVFFYKRHTYKYIRVPWQGKISALVAEAVYIQCSCGGFSAETLTNNTSYATATGIALDISGVSTGLQEIEIFMKVSGGGITGNARRVTIQIDPT